MLRMMNKRPLVWFAACWVCGSAAAAGLGPRGALLAAVAAALLAVAATASRLATGRLAALCLLAFCLAAGQRLWADERNATELGPLLAAAEAAGPKAAFAAEVSGTIASAVEVDGDRVTFRMKVDAVLAEGVVPPLGAGELLLVQLRLASQPEQAVAAAWQRGDRVRAAGELARPAAASNRGGFDYRRYLRSQSIHWLLKVKGAAAVTTEPAAGWNAAALLGRVDEARASLGARLGGLYPSHQSGYMQGLILGLREGLDPEQFEQFAKLGLTHILAISGLHVAVFMVMLGSLLRLCRMSRERIYTTLIWSIPFYVLLTGASPSVLRAGIMAILGLIAARLGKLKDGLHLLAAAAVAMLAYDPYYLDAVSFQLSFAVTFGLICGVPPLRRLLPRRKGLGWLYDLVAVTVAAQLVSFPLTIYYFNQFHLLSLLANFVLVPFISFIVMPLGTAALLLSTVWYQGAEWLADVTAYSNDWTYKAVERLASAGELRLVWATPPLWWVAGYLILLFLFFRRLNLALPHPAACERSKPAAAIADEPTAPLDSFPNDPLIPGLAPTFINKSLATGRGSLIMCAAALAVLVLYAYFPDRFDRTAAVSFLDVGQGDSALIRTPSGKHILIDGGGTFTYRKPGEEWRERRDPFEVGRKVVVPLLMKRGVRQIDVLVVSHLDGDHIRGLKAVVESIPVKAVWWNGTLKRSEDAEALIELLLKADIPLYAFHAGDTAAIDDFTKIDVLWPAKPAGKGIVFEEEQNEASLVLIMEIYGRRFLFTGDIGARTEAAILAEIERRDADAGYLSSDPADIMKIAHHGSKYSTSQEWLDYWSPRGTVISVGGSNTYGHPHPDVVGRLERSGASIWRTDTGGEAAFLVTKKMLYYSAK
ncbi:DNA internalization-related competence protein ComEC/Rec2 [Paenibacillus sp. LHD-117]|uniref:DNA internalization-related competence protein ComEC/Rec2 n=1 Tax=Paenibacillus sp. LHD-117 TaxID=3071412 RepID=UPI0027E1D3AB|nr:DNA internalization-related competence protein ComEC/Rec2 [Paenibacillus sp. LHD-117]MDQ6423325.1 DNA internalization-related competence protein ComEC/Rec2 [Paenibacillus sp. LHD-117]